MGNVFLHHHVKIRAAEAEGADAGAAHAFRRFGPRPQRGVDLERRVGEIDIRIGMLAVYAGRQHACRAVPAPFSKCRRAGRALQMPDVRFHRAQRDRAAIHAMLARAPPRCSPLPPRPPRWWTCRGPRTASRWPAKPRRSAQARSMAIFWPDGIGRGDALALAVARSADAAHHGVDLVPVALGVFQALQQEDGAAFAHDEAVGAFGVGPRAGGGERADFAELDECGRAHVAVDAAA